MEALTPLSILLAEARRLGLRFDEIGTASESRLGCWPSGLLTDELRCALRTHKDVILRALHVWGLEAGLHVLWFLHVSLPPEVPLQLDGCRRVVEPGRLWYELYVAVQAGPDGPRARTGALQEDLHLLYEHPLLVDGLGGVQAAMPLLVAIRGP